MKELKAKARDSRSVKPRRNSCQPKQGRESSIGVSSCLEPRESDSQAENANKLKLNTGIKPLQPQLAPGEQTQQFENSWQRLSAQAQRINTLAAQLEAAMFELKAIANEVNCTQRIKRNSPKPLRKACKFLKASVPDVKCNKAGEFVLATRSIDLFRAEREATQLAQTLRRRANRKRAVSTLSSNKPRFLGWLL